jgi:hypothetical protein
VKHAGKKRKSRIVSLRIDEDEFTLLDALARQTSCSRGEVLRRCLTGAQLKSTIDARRATSGGERPSQVPRGSSQRIFPVSPVATTSSLPASSSTRSRPRTPAPGPSARITSSSHFTPTIGGSSEGSFSGTSRSGGGFRRPRTRAPGIISSPPALPNAMLARFAV